MAKNRSRQTGTITKLSMWTHPTTYCTFCKTYIKSDEGAEYVVSKWVPIKGRRTVGQEGERISFFPFMQNETGDNSFHCHILGDEATLLESK
jgi:hypothetical protein